MPRRRRDTASDVQKLGTDSLTIVEIGEELGRRFNVYLSDDTIDSLRTVQDAIDAIVQHDGAKPVAAAVAAGKPTSPTKPTNDRIVKSLTPAQVHEKRTRATGFVAKFGFMGLVIGGLLGLGGAALVSASGINSVDLPPIAAPTATATTPTPTETPSPEPTSKTEAPKPTIDASDTQVSPGQRFILSGTFPNSATGEKLQVEVRESGEGWDDFPIETTTRDGGAFKTELYTSRTGQREFRVTNKTTNTSTPSVKVTIG
ncbi:phosphopantetheine-binding protein [Aeromicrobium sp. UC242_57]|uniref:phosphopantetheine-binding protein n=1 Tax=Aeromicrobium sp. UC242_57 TaxID=3374624 RepID=UPI0037972F3F